MRTADRSTRRARAAASALTGVLLVGAAIATVQLLTGPLAVGGTSGGDSLPADSAWLDDGVLGPDDGVVDAGHRPDVFDDTAPAVSRLSPELLGALRAAATDARASGVEFRVTSGWRSTALQAALRADAVARYGSEEEAARWVATPEASKHVSGHAVDLGDWDALDWLAQHGAAYGLCQTLANEAWHYEYVPEAVGGVCPRMSLDAAARG